MNREIYVLKFSPAIDMQEVENTLVLALLATENLHGETVMRLDAKHTFDPATRQCVIDTSTDVGRDLAKLFIGFASREYRSHSFTVEHVPAAPTAVARH